ncbi:hypothetical protein BGW42_003134 [Actinomortierella wolfii]|nr:hypothetical protein BGW42_003134 [Actinomortierella wolfii]
MLSQSRPRPRSRVTGQLLLLTNPRESSSNDMRFQAILHNTIALDHFRQFCFQEYSIENLLFWMDVELFASPSQELLALDEKQDEFEDQTAGEEEDDDDDEVEYGEERREEMAATEAGEITGQATKTSTARHPSLSQQEHFSVQHARYIYLTYIDACAPLQVNLSDEIRSEIPWPIVDGTFDGQGPAIDRHMFDAAQEHTYQLMKGHTLVRFEESELWKAVETMIQENPDEYNRANIEGTFNSYYRPNISVIRDLVRRSKSRSPNALPHALYNWNNSTSDLDRSRDKEETLAEVMSQYFGPIPAALRHQTKLLRGLGLLSRAEEEEYEMGFGGSTTTQKSLRDGGFGCGDISRPPGMPRSNSNNTFLSVYGINGQDVNQSNRNSIISSSVDLATTKSLSSASAIATRWMVAGYFDDEIRLTSAQRRKLLHRNNKLTRFFGSRVDGTLMPLNESTDHVVGPLQKQQGNEKSESPSGRKSSGHRSTASSASAGSSITPAAALSSLSMALSTSNSRDQDSKGNTNDFSTAEKRASIGPNATTFSGIGSRRGSKSMIIRLPSQRERFFARFRPRSTCVESTTQSPSTTTEHHRFSFVVKARQSGANANNAGCGTSTASFPSLKEGFLSRTSISSSAPAKLSRKRVATQPHPLPHPLWMSHLDRRGSLSDQEGVSPSSESISFRRERQRVMSLMNTFGSDDNAVAAVDADMTSSISARSTALHRLDSNANLTEQDHHHTLRSRRKKADKLASFFGTPLTPGELSTQLKMEQEAGSLVSDQSTRSQQSSTSKRSSKSSHMQQETQPQAQSYASINQLSERDRSILWKRSKKLKELLGQTLPEMDVEAALTRPILRRRSSCRSIMPIHPHYLTSSSYSQHLHVPTSFRRRRPGSRVSIRSRRSSVASHYHVRRRQSTVSTSGMRPISTTSLESSEWLLQGQDGSRTPTSPHRSIRSAKASSQSHGQYLTPAGHSHTGQTAADEKDAVDVDDGIFKLDDANHHYDTQADAKEEDDDDELYEEVNTDDDEFEDLDRITDPATKITGTAAQDANTASRLGQKKRMDKIHQFMGERVPKQDLLVGAVGRETALKMLKSLMAEDGLYADEWEDASPPPPAVAIGGRRQTLSGVTPATSSIAKLRSRKRSLMTKRRSKKAATATVAAAAVHSQEEKSKEAEKDDGDGIQQTSSSLTATATAAGDGVGDNEDLTVSSSSPLVSQAAQLGGLLHYNRGEKKKVRAERSLSDPPVLPSSFAPRAFVKGVFRSYKDHGNGSRNSQQLARGSAASSSASSSPKQSAVFGRTSADAILSKTTYISGVVPGELKCLDEEALHSMPRLRTMAAGDKERFMKRAEKLNRLFGAIPPSALLESSLTTFPITNGLRTEDDDEDSETQAMEEVVRANTPSTADRLQHKEGETTRASAGTGATAPSRPSKDNGASGSVTSFSSLYELAGCLANHTGGSVSSKPNDQKDETARVVESLAI